MPGRSELGNNRTSTICLSAKGVAAPKSDDTGDQVVASTTLPPRSTDSATRCRRPLNQPVPVGGRMEGSAEDDAGVGEGPRLAARRAARALIAATVAVMSVTLKIR